MIGFMMRPALLTLSLLVVAPAARANVPAAYFPCEGLVDGDACEMTGYGEGTCVLDTLCEDDVDPDSPWNECLLCGDPCRGLPERSVCGLPDGTKGFCGRGAGCEDEPRRSFDECNRCLPTLDASCKAADGSGVGHWEEVEAPAECNQLGIIAAHGRCYLCKPGPGELTGALPVGCAQGRPAPSSGGTLAAVGLWLLIALGLWRERRTK